MFTKVTFFQSTDYNLFHFFDFNRKVSKAHVKRLTESMKKRGFTCAILVIKTDIIDGVMRYYVLDGQHRFSAAKKLNIPFTFDVVEVNSKLELASYIADVNNSSKAWGTNQFLNVWADMEIAEYIKLNKVFNEAKIQITPLVMIYTGSSKMTKFRAGEMTFPDEVESDKIVSQMIDLNDFLPHKAFCRRSIIKAMRHPNYNHKLIKPYIIRQSKNSVFSENEKDLKDELFKLIDLSVRMKVA